MTGPHSRSGRPFTFNRNQCSDSIGIGVHFESEPVFRFDRNMHHETVACISYVESRRGALVERGGSGCFRRLSPQCRCLSFHLDYVSSPRSSNPTCEFPALGSRSRSPRPRQAGRPPLPAHEAHVLPQALVRVAHVLPRPYLVLPAQPLEQLRPLRVERCVAGAARPGRSSSPSRASPGSIVPRSHLRPAVRTALAATRRPCGSCCGGSPRTGACRLCPARVLTVVAPYAVPEKLQRFLQHAQPTALPRVDRRPQALHHPLDPLLQAPVGQMTYTSATHHSTPATESGEGI